MSEKTGKNERSNRWVTVLELVLLDVFAVNFSYYFALVLRFFESHNGARFMPLFLKFAPWYTVCCIIVFWCFKLYNGMWKYAGWNDLNRVVWANAVTFVIQVAGTLLFVRRMPITYYVLGAGFQFVLTCLSRFSYRFFAVERSKYRKAKNASVNVMIVGAGETARMLLRQLENDGGNDARPVCVLDYRNLESGRLFNGLPVVGGIDCLEDTANKYGVKSVILADPLMPAEVRKKIREQCETAGIPVQDISLLAQGLSEGISFRKLLAYVNGPLTVGIDGKSMEYDNGEKALAALPEKYAVKSVSAVSGRLFVEIEKDTSVLNNTDEPWARDYEKATGEEISFF